MAADVEFWLCSAAVGQAYVVFFPTNAVLALPSFEGLNPVASFTSKPQCHILAGQQSRGSIKIHCLKALSSQIIG